MKVAFFSDNVAYSTFAGVISGWSHALVAAGQKDIDVISYVGDPVRDAHSPFPEEVRQIKLPSPRTLYSVFPLRRYLAKTAPDILISAGTHVNLAALSAAKLAKWPGKLIISHHHPIELDHAHTPKDNKYLARWMYPWAQGLIAVSPGVLDDTIRKCNMSPAKAACIPNLLTPLPDADDAPVHEWLSNKRPKGPVFVTISRLVPVKNFPLLLAAFEKVTQELDSRLLIIGSGAEEQNIRSDIKAMGLESKVELTGFVDSLMPFLRKADALVISSDEEGFCQVLTEAMREGLPVISTDAEGGGPNYVLDRGEFGLLVPRRDVLALSKAMLKMADPEVRHKYGKLGRRRAMDFTPQAVSQRMMDFILRIEGASSS